MDEIDDDPGANDEVTENEINAELRDILGTTTNDKEESDGEEDHPMKKVKCSFGIATPVRQTVSEGKLDTSYEDFVYC